MPHSLETLTRSQAAYDGRVARREAYQASPADDGNLNDLRYVCMIELVTEGDWVELDAEDRDHANALAQSVIDHWRNVNTVAIRRVWHNGSVSGPLRILDFRDKQAA